MFHVGKSELKAFIGSYRQLARARSCFVGLSRHAGLPLQPLNLGGQRPMDFTHQLGLATDHCCGVFWETGHHQGLEHSKI